uniref:Uncharacterized protein n=1 Tax=Ditylum brightwellii TaxID=49249 RepID=A0A7S4SGN1_9STRA
MFITEAHQITELIRLNLQAGGKSMSLGAFTPALFYLKEGLSLLGSNSWEEQYDLHLRLCESYAEAKYCAGEFEEMHKIVDEILANAKCLDDKLGAYFTLVTSLNAQGKTRESIKVGLYVLSSLGEPMPAHLDMEAAGIIELKKTKHILEGKTDNEILTLKALGNNHKIAAMRLMYGLALGCFFDRRDIYVWLISKMVQISISDGICKESAFAFATFGALMATVDVILDVNSASRIGKLSLRLLQILQAEEYTAGIYGAVYFFTQTRVDHFRKSLEPMNHAYNVGLRFGEIHYAIAAAKCVCMLSFWSGENLMTVLEKIKYYEVKVKEHKQEIFWRLIIPYEKAIHHLTGQPNEIDKFFWDGAEEEQLLKYARKSNMVLLRIIYYVRAWIAYMFRDYKLASRMVEEERQCIKDGCSYLAPNFLKTISLFVAGLISFELLHETDDVKWVEIAEASMKEMEIYAAHGPSNYKHKLLLLQAESAFLYGEDNDAAKLYDSAIKAADDNGFIQDQAVACERAGIFHMKRGNTSTASHYYGQAHNAYLKLGAEKKASHLRLQCPF